MILASDPDVACFVGTHWIIFAGGVLVTLVYTLGFPLGWLWFITAKKSVRAG